VLSAAEKMVARNQRSVCFNEKRFQKNYSFSGKVYHFPVFGCQTESEQKTLSIFLARTENH
jgi:hypothetical protein